MKESDQNNIQNAIQNGFFNEGVYRINEQNVASTGVSGFPETQKKEDTKIIISAEQLLSVTEEPSNNLTLLKHDVEPTVIAETEKSVIELIPTSSLANDEKGNIGKINNSVEIFGGNKKGVAILVNYPDERWIHFKDKIILERILASVKLSFEDVALINTHYYKPESLDELSDALQISKLIGFAVNDTFLKAIKREVPEKTSKTAIFLMNSDLDEIAMNVDKKRILWNNIKLMFNI